ncbi:hypothetical protein Taro_025756 [Colocasia esculenta]|uniref:Uncharacterized protein n=1 Tax=Colocasia esculenta TaxID=4460 RepID=A0A843VP88_COLES|nr:hypothetical protein [Colocasia esculenta]
MAPSVLSAYLERSNEQMMQLMMIGMKMAQMLWREIQEKMNFTSALAGLPASMKDKLAATSQSKGILGKLHESAQPISTGDALKIVSADEAAQAAAS